MFHGPRVSRYICFVQALSRLAVQEDTFVPENALDQVIHGGFLELAAVIRTATDGRHRREGGRTLDGLVKKISDVNRALFSTEHAARNALAPDILAFVVSAVPVVGGFQAPFAGI